MSRGLIMERDLSPSALSQSNTYLRPHAMLVRNPFFDRVDLDDPRMVRFLESHGAKIDTERDCITYDDYVFYHKPKVSFELARSHVFLLLSFWDPQHQEVVERIIDPTLDEYEVFPMEQLRRKVAAFESVIFTGELTERFCLRRDLLTRRQAADLASIYASRNITPGEESSADEMELVRIFLRAEKGSIGDPATWTYANNIPGFSGNSKADAQHDAKQQLLTDASFSDTSERIPEETIILRAEELQAVGVVTESAEPGEQALFPEPGPAQRLAPIEDSQSGDLEVTQYDIITSDARWAEKKLLPLSRLANLVSYYHSKDVFCHALQEGQNPAEWLDDAQMLFVLLGLGTKLEERINTIADVSRRSDGMIDARTFSPAFFSASCELIRQMNELDLLVFVDDVGNIHGLFCAEHQRAEIDQNPESLRQLCGKSLCFMSHIDTVENGGRYDGRLGVLSGLEVVSLLRETFAVAKDEDLDSYLSQRPIMITAFCNEEMTFTGSQISMSGSAAVSGMASPTDIFTMQDVEGRVYGDCLKTYLAGLVDECSKATLRIANISTQDAPSGFVDIDPQMFFSAQTYERHIEQGPVLDRAEVPLVLVKGIRGIHQEDFSIEGENAALAAFELILRMRELQLKQDPDDQLIRVTSGVLSEAQTERIGPGHAVGITLLGEANHAGATLVEDRQDAGVAAARYIRFIREKLSTIVSDSEEVVPLFLGSVELLPGSGRNSIPGEVSFTLATTTAVTSATWAELLEEGERFIEEVLALPCAKGGEGIHSWKQETKEVLEVASRVTISCDMRFRSEDARSDFLFELDGVLEKISKNYQVRIQRSMEQEAEPIELTETGQVLQIERSYGGSHNPNEAMLLRDLLRGLLLQFDVALSILRGRPSSDRTLYQIAKSALSKVGVYEDLEFSSGALHDTCNIAKRTKYSDPL
jgi:acetylornithine deacetylase/succinyl-diaminopimelate desuccinylase-like protein